MMTHIQKRVALYAAPAVILCINFIAMQFTSEVNWTLSDFAVAAILLFGTAAVIDLVLRKVPSVKNRIFLTLLVLSALFLIWAELAVGIFGTPFAGS